MNKDDIKLPPLPYPYDTPSYRSVGAVIQDYALAAIKADRKQQDNEWKQAVDYELTTMLSTADSYDTPAEAVSALINWNVAVATDPAVSRQAHISTAPKLGEEK